jgi:hypothetical protein
MIAWCVSTEYPNDIWLIESMNASNATDREMLLMIFFKVTPLIKPCIDSEQAKPAFVPKENAESSAAA